MATMPLSVVMPMHNAARFVEAAIRSVLTQSRRDFIFYIVDDGSTDGSGDIAARIASHDERIHLIRSDNRGIVASLNHMLALVDTPFVARMDADDICLPERFARQLARMMAEPDLGALGTQFIEIDADDRVRDVGFRQPVGRDAVCAQLTVKQPLANPTVMFRTDALRAAGLYRQPFRHCEDYDLFLRLSQVVAIDNLPDVLFHYRRSDGQMSVRNISRQTRQAVFARLAHFERLAGFPDPFEGMDDLPEVGDLDALLGRAGVSAAVHDELAAALRYSVAVMDDAEFSMLCDQAASGRRMIDGHRTVLRCLANLRLRRAARLFASLVKGRRAAGSGSI